MSDHETHLWVCTSCGWMCRPNPCLVLADAECDNCGDEMEVTE